jgi:phospholipase D
MALCFRLYARLRFFVWGCLASVGFFLPSVSWGLSTDITHFNRFAAGTVYTVCFAPQMRCTQSVVMRIHAARKSIDVQAYVLTSRPIVRALTDAVKRGVKVRIIFDRANVKKRAKTYARDLWKSGALCFYDNGVKTAHNKVMIIDGEWVITGSFNFTYSAQFNNAENVLMIQSRQLAAQYERNWLYRRARSVACRF